MLLAIHSLLSSISMLLESFGPLGAGIASGMAGLAAAFAMGLATSKAVEAIARQPEAAGKIRTALLLGLAFAETAALYGFVIAIIISGK